MESPPPSSPPSKLDDDDEQKHAISSRKHRLDDSGSGHNKRQHLDPPLPSVSKLYAHALHCIFAFLSLAELAAVVQVSKKWCAAVGSVGPAQIGQNCHDQDRSPLPRHHSALTRHIYSLILVNLSTMEHSVPQLPNLRSLQAWIPADGPTVFRFPPRLQTLILSLDKPLSAAETNAILTAVALLQDLKEFELRPYSIDGIAPDVNFALLHPAPKLTHFLIQCPMRCHVAWDGICYWTDQQVADLRALPHLTILPCVSRHCHRDVIIRLLQRPGQPAWTSIGSTAGVLLVDTVLCDLLRTLTSVTELRVIYDAEGEQHQSFLTPLVNLTDLQLSDYSRHSIPGPALLQSLLGLQQLTRLVLDSQLDSNDMAQLLPHLPRLTELSLLRRSRIHSLQFLAAAPSLANTLTRLTIEAPIIHEPQHLHGLKALTHLIIRSETDPTPEQLVEWRRLRPRWQDVLGGEILPRLIVLKLLLRPGDLNAFET